MTNSDTQWFGSEWELRSFPLDSHGEGEPPTWDGKTELKIVGQPVPRMDGTAKVTGSARYTTDISLKGMLHAVVLRSPVASGKLKGIELNGIDALSEVLGIHEVAAIGATLRYEGQPILAIAATSERLARRAAAKVNLQIDRLPPVLDVESALAPDAPLVYPAVSAAPGKGKLPIQGNLRGPATGGRRFQAEGDVDAAFESAFLVQKEVFTTAVQTHSCLEPHGAVVEATEDGGFNVWTSTQSIASVVQDVARAFDIPRARVRVRADFVGGGFGSKFGAGQHTIMAAHLARKTGRPVRLILNRREEHLCGGNRPSSRQVVEMGWSREGSLLGVQVTSHGSAGVGTGAGVAAPFHMIYATANRRSFEFDVFTHTGASAAFRAPGHPQGVFALEGMVDLAARELGIDPIELRLKNDPHPVRRKQWELARERFGWDEKRREWSGKLFPDGKVRGVGAAASVWYNIVQTEVGATVELYSDGSARVLSGVQDIGVGIRTVIAQVAAETLQLGLEKIRVELGDSHHPEGPGSGGSKTTASLTPAVHEAAYRALEKLKPTAAVILGVAPSQIVFQDGYGMDSAGTGRIAIPEICARMGVDRVVGHGNRKGDREGILASDDKRWADLGRIIGGVQLAQIAVDPQLGIVEVEQVLAVQDCGRVMNPLQARSQVNGGIIQGLSYALYEERRLDPVDGQMLNGNLESYRIAGIPDLPVMDVVLTNTFSGRNSTGAMGLGEPVTVPTAAAIRNALFHATDCMVTALPMTPSRVLSALERKKR